MKSIILICLCVGASLAIPPKPKIVPVQHRSQVGIVGGDVAEPKQFPWQVAVYFDTSDGSYFCGGALVDLKWVLTAGHCVYHAKIFTLHLGANSLVDADDNRVTVTGTKSKIHPDYNNETMENDIGLIQIDGTVTLNDYIQIIPLASTELKGDVDVTVSGWGASGDWDGVVNDLNFVQLKSITNDDCKNVYGEVAIKDGMVCAVGPNNEGTCNGDSGSPLVTEDEDGNTVHAGIVSWASSSGCETDHPSGYTRTAYYLDWINSVIG